MKIKFTLLLLLLASMAFAQSAQKKIMTPEVFDEWNTISQQTISNNGKWIAYALTKEDGDGSLHIYNTSTQKTVNIPRGNGGKFSADSEFIVFKIKPAVDSIRAQKKRKVKKNDLTKDSLGIYQLATGQLQKVADVQSFQVPEKWAGFLAYHKTPSSTKGGKEAKKESKSNGSTLVIQNLKAAKTDTISFVKAFAFAKEGPRLVLHSTGNDSTFLQGVYVYYCEPMQLQALWQQKGDYEQLSIGDKGQQVAFIADLDTTKERTRPYELFYWKEKQKMARSIATMDSPFLPENWLISNNAMPRFSKDGSKLYFGTAPTPLLPDTSILAEDKAVVEVWSYTDPMLYTQQKVQLNREKRRTYLAVWHIASNTFVQLGDEKTPTVSTGNEGDAKVALSYNDLPYLQRTSWEGGPSYRDLYWINVINGGKTLIKKEMKGRAQLSPAAQYALWYDAVDTAWYTSPQMSTATIQITDNKKVVFYDSEDDHPMLPSPHGVLGWLEGDQSLMIYDKYDIWLIDPKGKAPAKALTNGRKDHIIYRYVRLDPEERFIQPDATLMLTHFNEITKEQGYSTLSLKTGKLQALFTEPVRLSRRPLKAKDSDDIVFTKEDFQTFPDLLHSQLDFKEITRVSHANPQQADYRWGTMEMMEWTSLDGEKLQGLLVKPDDFDPNKKYPLLVNFYERSSDGLYQHRAPYPHRSTINYSYYVNRGYIIFNPDVPYRIGYPGESAYNAVIPGVTKLINEGYIDEDRIGVQGHSWGATKLRTSLPKLTFSNVRNQVHPWSI